MDDIESSLVNASETARDVAVSLAGHVDAIEQRDPALGAELRETIELLHSVRSSLGTIGSRWHSTG